MAHSWFYRSQGRISGPVDFDDLAGLAVNGSLKLDDELRRGDQAEWVPAASVPGLFPEPEELLDLADLNFQLVESTSAVPRTAAAPGGSDSPATLDELNIRIVSEPAPHKAVVIGGNGPGESVAVPQPPLDGWYYRSLGQEELGPFPFDDLSRLIGEGALTSNDSVRRGLTGAWQRAARIPELERILQRVAPPAPETPPKQATKEPTPRREERKTPPADHSGDPGQRPADHVSPAAASAEPLPPPAPVEPPKPADRWFCNVDNIEHGPLTWDELLAMARHGRIKPETRIKQGDDGAWRVAATADGLFAGVAVPAANAAGAALAAAASSPAAYVPPKPKKEKRTREKRVRGPREPLLPRVTALIVKNKLVVFGVLGLAAVVVLVLIFFRGGSANDELHFKQIQAIWEEHKALKQRKAKKPDWQPLIDKARALSDEIQPILNKTASAQQPQRQHLLWATQDMIPMLNQGPAPATYEQDRFLGHMKAAAKLMNLSGDFDSPDGAYAGKKSR